jgi:hypothetical protein
LENAAKAALGACCGSDNGQKSTFPQGGNGCGLFDGQKKKYPDGIAVFFISNVPIISPHA